MNLRFIYTILLLLFTVNIFCQDVIIKKDSAKKDVRVGDYIKFNVQCGAVINNAYCNVSRKGDDHSKMTYVEYHNYKNKKYYSSVNIGFNFIFGRSKFIKHVIGVNYLQSKGDYLQISSGVSKDATERYYSYTNESIVHTKFDLLNFCSGIKLKIIKDVFLETNLVLNYTIRKRAQKTVTAHKEYLTVYLMVPDTTYTKSENENYDRLYTVSFCPKLSYEFEIKKQKAGVYLSYNLALGYNLPWWMFGVIYYPFKKLK